MARTFRVGIIVLSVTIVIALVVVFRIQDRSAHAGYDRSTPAAGAVVDPAPALVEVWFTLEIDVGGTVITVSGPDGSRVDLDDETFDLNDLSRKRVTVTLRPDLGPGPYTVRWTTLSAEDGEEESGEFTFIIGGDYAEHAAGAF